MPPICAPFALLGVILALGVSAVMAKPPLKPQEFQPLVSLPWEKPNVKPSEVIEAIFREPNQALHTAVLEAYLEIIPLEQFGSAFDLSIALNGEGAPDRLIYGFLPVWARRDPDRCWERVKPMFRLAVESEGWLSLDHWGDTIRVYDQNAVETSSFWIENKDTLAAFVAGVSESDLPAAEKSEWIAQFADEWQRVYATKSEVGEAQPEVTVSEWRLVQQVFHLPSRELPSVSLENEPSLAQTVAFEVALRRWLIAEPAAAPKIVERARTLRNAYPGGASNEFLLLWMQVARSGLLKWIGGVGRDPQISANSAKGLLMSTSSATLRKRWLREAKRTDESLDLIGNWASWDPKLAWEAALATNDTEIIGHTADQAAYGPFRSPNTCAYGQSQVQEFDASRILPHQRESAFSSWETIMEQWGDNNIGQAARYGLNFILRTAPEAKRELVLLYSGYERPTTDGDVRDRTFCALRVWAVVRPTEMRKWIATVSNRNLRNALYWLAANPWGGHSDDGTRPATDFPPTYASDLAGWVERDMKSDSPEIVNAKSSLREWRVFLRDGRPHAAPHPGTLRDRAAELPFQPQAGTLKRVEDYQRVEGGWLIAFNEGEFGTALYWYSPAGKTHYEISRDWVNKLFAHGKNVYALTQTSGSEGAVLRFQKTSRDKHWKVVAVTKLPSIPYEAVVKRDGEMIVTLDDSIVSLGLKSGKLGFREYTPGTSLYPRSSVLSLDEHKLYIGMRGVVSVFDLTTRVFRFFVPSDTFLAKLQDPSVDD